jgi:hypothetical protein
VLGPSKGDEYGWQMGLANVANVVGECGGQVWWASAVDECGW